MLQKLSEKLSSRLVSHGADPAMEPVYAYGIECTLSTVIILALLTAAGVIMGRVPEMLIFIAAWLPLRMLAGGAHASTHLLCTVISVGCGIVTLFLSDALRNAPAAIIYLTAPVCYTVFFLTAPVVHKNHPMSARRRQRTRIIASRIFAGAECALILLLTYLRSSAAEVVFGGYLTAAILSVIGWFSKDTDRG